jgi:tRNA nucleotidyltransferase (CCA-adding enzyme)
MEEIAQSLPPQAPLAEVEQAVVGRRMRLVPVVEDDVLVGVITRTDLLNNLIREPPLSEISLLETPDGGFFRQKQVGGLMRERFPRPVLGILKALGRAADEMDFKLYLVGGSVRDLYLRRPNLDMDVVVEGDGIVFARRYAETREDVRVRAHKKFRTAKLIFDSGLVIDVATARLEYYDGPASLPTVELSSLKLDLYRRDFTINTLAITLNTGDFGRLIDFFGATRDLKEKAIRVLHNLSFVEDPTRVFRAVRFEQRFGFRIGKQTEGLIKNALKINAFERLSGGRLFSEMKQMFEEDRALACFQRLGELNLLKQFHPNLRLEMKSLDVWEGVDESLAWFRLSFINRPLRQWLVYFLALADTLKGRELQDLCARLGMGPKLKGEILLMRRQALAALNAMQRNHPSQSTIHRLLSPLRTAYLLFIMAKAEREWVKKAVSQYLTVLVNIKPEIRGRDLLEMGFKPGPLFTRMLDRLRDARLDGRVHSRDEELALIRKEYGHLLEKTA